MAFIKNAAKKCAHRRKQVSTKPWIVDLGQEEITGIAFGLQWFGLDPWGKYKDALFRKH